jgi:hypothetical protein
MTGRNRGAHAPHGRTKGPVGLGPGNIAPIRRRFRRCHIPGARPVQPDVSGRWPLGLDGQRRHAGHKPRHRLFHTAGTYRANAVVATAEEVMTTPELPVLGPTTKAGVPTPQSASTGTAGLSFRCGQIQPKA